MQEAVFHELADLALKVSGQSLSYSRAYLAEARLAPMIRREGFGGPEDLLHCINSRGNPRLIAETVAALTSKETWFFREREQLDMLMQAVVLIRPEKARIWIAGGSTGQEAYSVAMMAAEAGALGRIDIVSTDICKVSAEKARLGNFSHYDVQRGLSIQRLLTHCTKQISGDWQVKEPLRAVTSFRSHNLLESAAGLGQFDAIVCRHVLTGMARSARARVTANLAAQLAPGGLLLTSSSENLYGLCDCIEPEVDFPGAWRASQRRFNANAA
jgi:chemotaxis protein methyltransferase CheR